MLKMLHYIFYNFVFFLFGFLFAVIHLMKLTRNSVTNER